MVEIIIIIIVFSVIVKQNRKKNDYAAAKRRNAVTTASMGQQPAQKNVSAGQTPSQAGQYAMLRERGRNAVSAQDGRRNYQRNYDNLGNPKPEKQESERREGESTTEYLNRKAREDEREHKKEQFERKRAERQNYGSIVYAGRWMEGDPVPHSRRLVVCSYCGAENLVPVNDRTAYHCYFCREKL